jgi:hypothetical protein
VVNSRSPRPGMISGPQPIKQVGRVRKTPNFEL